MNQTTDAPQAAPVIAIDGPTASGKGTVAALVANALGFHYLDSGAIYRVLAVAVQNAGLDAQQAAHLPQLEAMAAQLPVTFAGERVLLSQNDVSTAIRTESAGSLASQLAALPGVRAGLLQRQRDFRLAPGLVADGRDMGSVVFPDAALKVFLTATAPVRAQRRVDQIIKRGEQADYARILADLQARDKRDSERAVAPLKPCEGAKILDCSDLPIDAVVQQILGWFKA